jgi:hypothetical protein
VQETVMMGIMWWIVSIGLALPLVLAFMAGNGGHVRLTW